MQSREYKTGNEAIDRLIQQIASSAGPAPTQALRREILTTAVKLGLESSDRGDLKLVNNSLKELRYSLKIFTPYRQRKKVIIFGSARTTKDMPAYAMAEDLARRLTAKGYMIVTGGGPGIMEAGNKGSLPGMDFALNIKLPFEQKPNPFLDEKERLINFKYFFVRKLIFIKETDATTLFPGGFGTHDEGFEMLTLVQTGKARPRPIVLMEPKGSTYWQDWKKFVARQLAGNGFIDESDTGLFETAQTAAQAVKIIEDFYRVYHSLRYVGEKTILRLNRPLSGNTVALLNRKFKGILVRGSIEPCPPSPEEVKERDLPQLPRLCMEFNLRDYSRLYDMIKAINKSPEGPL